MTTPQAKIPAARHWEPYPELPREPKDMQQVRHIYDNGAEGSTSAILNLNFRCLDRRFSVHDPMTGAAYEHPQEENARRRAELQRLRGEG